VDRTERFYRIDQLLNSRRAVPMKTLIEELGMSRATVKRATSVKLHFIQPGKPTQNAFVESFNGRLRDSCLDQHWFSDLLDARRTIST